MIYLGGNEQSTHKYISELLGKGTIDKKSSGESKGSHGSSSRNYDVLGRELMTPDEARKLNNKKCLVFIRGFDPILDDKFNPFRHKNFAWTADGKGRPYVHGITTDRQHVGKAFELLSGKSVSYYEKQKAKGENVYIASMTYEEFRVLGEGEWKKKFTIYEEGRNRPALKGEDSITKRLVTWSYSREQKEELRKALRENMPKDRILSFFYPEIPAEHMKKEIEIFEEETK